MDIELAARIMELGPGGHLCLFYDQDPAEQMPALIPFIQEGLTRDEQVIYIADDQTIDQLAGHLNRSGIDVNGETSRGRLSLCSRNEWRQPGELDSNKKAEQVREFIRQAARLGFKGVRFAVEMTWTLGPDISAEKLEHWEATINTLFEPAFPGRIICQYNRSRLSPDIMLAALHTHPVAILGQEVYPNIFYQAPLILNGNGHRNGNGHANGNGNGKASAAKLEWMLSQLQRARAAEKSRIEAEVLRESHEKILGIQVALRSSEQRLRAIIDHTPACIKVVAPDGTLLEMNFAGLRMVGASRADDALGKSVYDLIAPEDRERFRAMNERICRGSEDCLAFKMVGLDGRRHCMETHGVPLANATTQELNQLAITRDVSEAKQADLIHRRFAALVESSDDAIISKDLEGIIQSWNQGAERIFGYQAEEVIGRSIGILIPSGRANEEPEILARLRRGERIDHYETVRQRKDGCLVDISLTVSPIKDDRGIVIGASKIARDITARRQAEEALRAARKQLASLNEELEQHIEDHTASLREAIAQMEEFSYTVSHDLRAPARAMRGYAQIVLDDFGQSLDPQARDYLERIIRGGERMDTLIQDVLTYSRLSRRELISQPVALDKVLSDVIQLYPELQAPRAQISVRPPLLAVLGHEPSLAQSISNLLTNAAKFVPPGVVPRITVRTESRGDKVRLWIEDNGIGIKPEHQHRIFGIFERIPTEFRYDGTGIGLAIVRKAVEKMGGTVGLESDGLTGSRFWIELAGVPHHA